MSTLRTAVVGGGIVGTAVARHLAQTLDDAEVTLFEKEDTLAAHQTGHNSGGVHAGLYYEQDLVGGLVYPVPDPRYPFLGVHVTKRVDGAVMLGPNAFLSLGREAYRPRQVHLGDVRDALGFGGFWRFAAANVPAAVRESRTAVSSRRFVAEARRYLPAIDPALVRRDGRGIRAQAMDARGPLVDDFVITGTERMVHVRNAPSPGATSSLAIAEHIVAEALARRGHRPPPRRPEDQ
jgi:L-2-hydroxyglutarate oxidase